MKSTKIKDDEYFNSLCCEQPNQMLKIKAEAEEVLNNVDPAILTDMKARLSGESPPSAYDISDRIIDEMTLMREKKKLRRIFQSEDQVFRAFSSIQNIRLTQKKISFEEVDRVTLSDYAYICAKEETVDEMDFYRFFLFRADLITKKQRLGKWSKQTLFNEILESYSMSHFDTVKLSIESIQMSKALSNLFQQRKLGKLFDEFLDKFYGVLL
ncbi:MAG: hypothetical protein OXB88_06370 [Bacteriovoracales bacterium]|nr:hypothetical protein [Bacteriovoracales bacterium]